VQQEVSISKMASLREGMLFGIGNPLLDLQAHADNEFLQKWGLKEDDAILCDDKHIPMFQEMAVKYKVEYIAGGATQNALRVAQWIMGRPNIATFMGCIGEDEYGKILEENARSVGLNTVYQKHPTEKTGTCAALVLGSNRSLCAHLAAANHFTKAHLEVPDHLALLHKANFYYIAGFPLTVCPDVILDVAKHSHETGKTFMLNLSAAFIVHVFKEPMMKVFPYVDIIFGNETEAEEFSKEHQLGTSVLKDIAVKIAQLPKANSSRKRIVVLTQGSAPVCVAEGDHVVEYRTLDVPKEKILDTNGAGDSFVGGFLAQYVQGKSLEKCVECANWAAAVIIQRSGCTFPKICDYKA